MALELQPFMTMLDNYRRQHQRREQEEVRQRPARPPEWALRLNPDDFKGRTRQMLLAAQAAAPLAGGEGSDELMGGIRVGDPLAPGTANQMGKGDRLQPQQFAPSPDNMGIVDDGPVMDGINQVMEEERQRLQQRHQPAPASPAPMDPGVMRDPNRVPIRGFQPDSAQQPAQRQMPEPAAGMPMEQNAALSAPQARQNVNLRKAMGPAVDAGDYVMAQRHGGLSGGGGSDTLAGGATPRPQPTAARSGGSGMFGGSGPGLGYMIGGIGSLLQEASGQTGAAGRFAQTYGERYQQRTEANQTRQAAIDLGIDPEFARTAPISVLVPLLGPAYKQKHAPREPLVTRPGDVLLDPDTYQPLYENEKQADLPSDVRTAQYMFPGNVEAQRQWLSAKGHQQIQIGADGSVSIGPATGGLSKPTQTQIEKDIVHGEGVLETLDNVRAGYRPEFSTFAGRGQAMWSSLKAKGLGSLAPEEQKQLADYHNWASRSFSLLNEELNRLSGAISPAEAERLKKAMPNPGTGPLDMDDPVSYTAKLDRWEADLKTALRRNKYVLANGLAPDGTQPWRAMTSARFEAEFENEAAALSKQYQAQSMPEQEADMRAAQELAERYGF